jgi:hypothetical protein
MISSYFWFWALLAPGTFRLFGFPIFWSWARRRLFQKRVMHTNVDIYVFIMSRRTDIGIVFLGIRPNNLNVPGASNAQNQKIGKPDNLNVPGVSKPNALKLFSMYFCTRNLTKQNTVKDQSFNSLGDYAFSHSGLFFTRNKNHIIYFLDMNNQ